MKKELSPLSNLSMASANFGNGLVYKDIFLDWFNFLGGKPGEVVIVDGGSDLETQTLYWELYQQGLIDKLQIIQTNHSDNNKDTCYIQEYTAGAITSKAYVLFFKIDTIPYREGHENWLKEAMEYLEREDVFAFGGSFNLPSKHHDAWPGWYFSHKCSLNFCLMKRTSFMNAMHEFADSYIISGFKGNNPAAITKQDRYLIEVALEKYIEKHKKYTLCKIEDPTWTIFHMNIKDERLQKYRNKYLQRQNIDKFMNAGAEMGERVYGAGKYYGRKPKFGLIKRIRIWFGTTKIGSYWRRFKNKIVDNKAN